MEAEDVSVAHGEVHSARTQSEDQTVAEALSHLLSLTRQHSQQLSSLHAEHASLRAEVDALGRSLPVSPAKGSAAVPVVGRPARSSAGSAPLLATAKVAARQKSPLQRSPSPEIKDQQVVSVGRAKSSSSRPAQATPVSMTLQVAVQRGREDVVQRLLRSKANPDEHDEKKVSILHLAAFGGAESLCRLLLKAKANVNCKDQHGQTPMFFAPNPAVCDVLYEQRADINTANNKGQTALHFAGQAGMGEVLLWLSERMPPEVLEFKDAYNATGAYYAQSSGTVSKEVCQKLREAGQPVAESLPTVLEDGTEGDGASSTVPNNSAPVTPTLETERNSPPSPTSPANAQRNVSPFQSFRDLSPPPRDRADSRYQRTRTPVVQRPSQRPTTPTASQQVAMAVRKPSRTFRERNMEQLNDIKERQLRHQAARNSSPVELCFGRPVYPTKVTTGRASMQGSSSQKAIMPPQNNSAPSRPRRSLTSPAGIGAAAPTNEIPAKAAQSGHPGRSGSSSNPPSPGPASPNRSPVSQTRNTSAESKAPVSTQVERSVSPALGSFVQRAASPAAAREAEATPDQPRLGDAPRKESPKMTLREARAAVSNSQQRRASPENALGDLNSMDPALATKKFVTPFQTRDDLRASSPHINEGSGNIAISHHVSLAEPQPAVAGATPREPDLSNKAELELSPPAVQADEVDADTEPLPPPAVEAATEVEQPPPPAVAAAMEVPGEPCGAPTVPIADAEIGTVQEACDKNVQDSTNSAAKLNSRETMQLEGELEVGRGLDAQQALASAESEPASCEMPEDRPEANIAPSDDGKSAVEASEHLSIPELGGDLDELEALGVHPDPSGDLDELEELGVHPDPDGDLDELEALGIIDDPLGDAGGFVETTLADGSEIGELPTISELGELGDLDDLEEAF